MLAKIAYWVAVLAWISVPPAVVYWLMVHPFARQWRRLGRGVSFTIVIAVCVGVGYLLYRVKDQAFAVHWGFHWQLILLGVPVWLFAAWLEVLCRRHLKFHVLAGAPELAPEGTAGKLLTEGIYARTRNPRYLSFVFGMLGWSLILNYPALYAMTLASIPLLQLVVLLEERELRDRFGEPYEQYCEEVPRWWRFT